MLFSLFTWVMLLIWPMAQLSPCDSPLPLPANNGTLISEVNPAHYQKPTLCVWDIKVSFGKRIQLDIQVFDIETACCSCDKDFVEFQDGLTVSSPIIGRYCGKNWPERVYSSGNTLRVRYASSVQSQARNLSSVNKFRAVYRTVCGHVFRNVSGEFTSPGYPDYSKSRCLYTIIVPFGWVKLKFTDFIVSLREQHSPMYMERCEKNFVVLNEVSHVEFKGTHHGQRLCGRLKSTHFISSGGRVLSLLYESSIHSRFSAQFEAVSHSSAKCGGLVTDDAGYIYSYGYPHQYPANTKCTWKIEVLHGFIELRFLVFNFSVWSTTCTNGRVDILDGWAASAVKIRTNCGRLVKMPSRILSTTNRLLIRATSTANPRSTGRFLLSYKVVQEGLCHRDQFSCLHSYQCVERDTVCDNTDDCSDRSDELNCPNKKEKKALYALWAIFVVVAMFLMGFWLWRTWKKAVRHTIVVQRDDCTRDDEDEECSEMYQSRAPPSYNEALQQGVQTCNLPTYEEAICDDDTEIVLLETDNNVRFINSQNSYSSNLLPSTNGLEDVESTQMHQTTFPTNV